MNRRLTSRYRRINCAGIHCRCRPLPTDFVDGLVPVAGNGSPDAHSRMRHLSVCRQSADAAAIFLQRRRRNAHRAAAWRAAARHGTRVPAHRAPGNRGDPARPALPGGSSRGRRTRLHLREFRRTVQAAGSWTHRFQWPRQSTRFSDAAARYEDLDVGLRADRQVLGPACGLRPWIIRRWMWWRGTATMLPTNTICGASTPWDRSRTIIPIRRSFRCCIRRARRRARATSTSWFFRRAGWPCRTPFGRRGFTAMWPMSSWA